MEDHGPYTFQTSGNCQPICLGLNKPVMGLVDGSNCWCGDLLPPKDTKVDNSSCNTPCNGFDKEMCGGNGFWTVYLTGLNRNQIENYDPSAAKASGAKSSAPAAVVTVGGSTVVMTVPGQTATGTGSSSSSSGPSKAGIAVGAVVGVVALAGIIGGVLFFLRQKRRRQVEEEYRRQAAVNSFVAGGKPPHTSASSMNDSRLDPEVMMRRQSDGSIADNQDYSRRILKVTNPDGH